MVQMNLFAGQEQRRRHRERTRGPGGEREGGMNWEIRIDIYTLPCVKQVASGNLVYSTGSPARCSVMTQMGGMGDGGGRSKREGIQVYIQLIHFIVQKKLTQHCKAIILPIKNKMSVDDAREKKSERLGGALLWSSMKTTAKKPLEVTGLRLICTPRRIFWQNVQPALEWGKLRRRETRQRLSH